MEREKSWETITAIGLDIRKGWEVFASEHELSINHWGLPALTGFTLNSDDTLKYNKFITQEMLKKNWLAGNIVLL